MARNFATYILELTTGAAGPETVCQIIPATNHPVVLHNVEVDPRGASGATAPLRFEALEQDDAGSTTDDTAALQKIKPGPTAALQLAMRKSADGAEPTTTTGGQRQAMTVHQQASRLWVPQSPFKEMLIDTGERLGIVFKESLAIALTICLVVEE